MRANGGVAHLASLLLLRLCAEPRGGVGGGGGGGGGGCGDRGGDSGGEPGAASGRDSSWLSRGGGGAAAAAAATRLRDSVIRLHDALHIGLHLRLADQP